MKRKLLITVEAQEMMDPETGQGYLHFTLADTAVKVSAGKDGEELGEVVGCIGGGTELRDQRVECGDHGKASFFIPAMELWNGFQRALVSVRLVEEPIIHVPKERDEEKDDRRLKKLREVRDRAVDRMNKRTKRGGRR